MAILGLSREQVYSVNVWCPPLAEQRRIVAQVEALLARVQAARARLAKVPALLNRFRQSVLAAACSGQFTAGSREAAVGDNESDLPYGWQHENVESVCTNIVDCPHSTPKWASHGKLCLRTTNFRPGRLDLSEVRFVSEQTFAERTIRLVPRPGDVVYSREGGILVLNSPQITERVRELTGGSASPHLNVGDIKQFPLPLPPLAEQRAIVGRVDALFALADKIEARVAAATARVEKITQAILAKAFRGELVPTEAELARAEGRDYEPASVLLERIRTGRTQAQPPDARKRRRAAEPQ